MTDTERLITSSRSSFTRELLRAGLRDDPSASSMRAVAKRLGLASSAGLAAGAVSGLALPAAAQGAGEAAATVGGAGAAGTIVKWLAIGAMAGGAAIGGATAVQRSLGNDVPVTRSTPARAALPRTAASAQSHQLRPQRSEPSPPGSSSKLGQAPPLATAETMRSSQPRRSASDLGPTRDVERRQGALAREAAWIDAARRALDAGDLRGARAALDDYERGREVGILNREALVLRVELLSRLGKTSQARELTQQLADRYPGDPHVTRLLSRFSEPEPGIERALP